MQDFDITHFWMLGVMLIMCVFFGAAVLGHIYKNHH